MSAQSADEADKIARNIRRFADQVERPDRWMIVVPTKHFDEVKDRLDVDEDLGTTFEGISLCWGRKAEETRVKYKSPLSEHKPFFSDSGRDGGQS